jgi:hypothetical protein
LQIRTCLAASVLFASSVACAQFEPDAATVSYFSSKTYGEITIYFGILLDKSVLAMDKCDGSYGFDPITFSIQQPLQFRPGNEHPVTGRWTYRFKFKRCSTEKIYNVLWEANPAGLPKPSGLPPGTSRADLSLALTLKNAVGSAGLVLYGAPQECRSIRVLDTRVTMEPTTMAIDGIKREGVWEEEWTAHMCGVDFKAPLCLVPSSPRGTNWTSKPCPR